MALRPLLRRFPPVAKRDAQIRQLRRQVDKLERRLAVPSPPPPRYRPRVASWHARILEQQRVQSAVARDERAHAHACHNLFLKLHNYEVARSHGVSTPQVLGVWPTATGIDWDSLPEQFVLKSNGGSTGRGVLPLQRTGSGFELIDGSAQYTPQEIAEHYRSARGARAPFFAEALLPGGQEQLPDDVKVFAFYGEVALVLLRRMPVHADTAVARVRMVGPDGTDLGTVQRGRTYDTSLEVPAKLPLMVETASALSLAVPLPAVRVDLYAGGEGVVLGELTPLPGDSHTFTRQWDEDLGNRYERAEARLQLDLAEGRPFAVLRGDHDPTLTTPMPPTTIAPVRPMWASPVD
ncbi:ATP-grasp fold amidoligase family protein [Georgenia sp. Marseille-Q6866]